MTQAEGPFHIKGASIYCMGSYFCNMRERAAGGEVPVPVTVVVAHGGRTPDGNPFGDLEMDIQFICDALNEKARAHPLFDRKGKVWHRPAPATTTEKEL